MNRTLVFATVLASGLATATLGAQTAATAPAASPAAAVTPQAIPAKIAIIAFDQVVFATNEGQRAVATVQKKYEPQKAKIDSESAEVDSLRKQLQALPASTADEERANRMKVIDQKEKQLNLDAESAQNSYNEDLQKAFATVANKVGTFASGYAKQQGFTMMLNVGGGQQSPSQVLWAEPATDISQAVVTAYNASSGVSAPPPSAPSATTPRRTSPASAPRK